ncbi:hypothetical protein NQ318_017777 [Aromia moschata]|uniref:Uncharacterized protein n=1 Tax=Aromia moschata TaxID=1265417 RepID=A0AAV8XVT8_9CUCU|nr:hypothetical protein NQ318_017777 [Aromia moschata]
MDNDMGRNLPIIINDEPEPNSMSEEIPSSMIHGRSMDSTQSTFTNEALVHNNSLEPDTSLEQEEKARLISQVLELQNTLDDLSQRVNSVKEENLRSENQVLGQYTFTWLILAGLFFPRRTFTVIELDPDPGSCLTPNHRRRYKVTILTNIPSYPRNYGYCSPLFGWTHRDIPFYFCSVESLTGYHPHNSLNTQSNLSKCSNPSDHFRQSYND